MQNSYQINEVRTMALDVKDVLSGGRKNDKDRIASVVEMVLATESFFPDSPLSLTRNVSSFLRRKVDNGCPSCVNREDMVVYMDEVKQTLRGYLEDLEEWLAVFGVTIRPDEKNAPINVHNLKSNI